jgi:hypothetical protein
VSRRPAGGSTIGVRHSAARAVTQRWYWVAMSVKTALLTGYCCRYVLKNPTTRSGCWNGWISPFLGGHPKPAIDGHLKTGHHTT